MRQLTALLFICLSIGFTSTKNTAIQSNKLNGTWIPVSQEFAGTAMPKKVFENQKLIIDDSAYTVIAESVDKGVVTYKDDKIDIYGKEGVNAGKHFTAIYKFENEQLTICYNLAGDSYPEAFDTKGKQLYFLSVFVKEAVK